MYVLHGTISGYKYIGSTRNVQRRLQEHNAGETQSTKAYRPFELELFVAVRSEKKARELERCFKGGSGQAVLRNLSPSALTALVAVRRDGSKGNLLFAAHFAGIPFLSKFPARGNFFAIGLPFP